MDNKTTKRFYNVLNNISILDFDDFLDEVEKL